MPSSETPSRQYATKREPTIADVAAVLRQHGFTEVASADGITAGQQVQHVRTPERGTATVVALYQAPRNGARAPRTDVLVRQDGRIEKWPLSSVRTDPSA